MGGAPLVVTPSGPAQSCLAGNAILEGPRAQASASRTDLWPAPSLKWLMNSRETVYTNSKNALVRWEEEKS